MGDLKKVCHFVEIVNHKTNYHNLYTIIGQIWGDDTSVGDTDLLDILCGINYVWFDARCPKIIGGVENGKVYSKIQEYNTP